MKQQALRLGATASTVPLCNDIVFVHGIVRGVRCGELAFSAFGRRRCGGAASNATSDLSGETLESLSRWAASPSPGSEVNPQAVGSGAGWVVPPGTVDSGSASVSSAAAGGQQAKANRTGRDRFMVGGFRRRLFLQHANATRPTLSHRAARELFG